MRRRDNLTEAFVQPGIVPGAVKWLKISMQLCFRQLSRKHLLPAQRRVKAVAA